MGLFVFGWGGGGVFDEPGYPSSSQRLTLTGIALVVVCPAFAEDHSLGLYTKVFLLVFLKMVCFVGGGGGGKHFFKCLL